MKATIVSAGGVASRVLVGNHQLTFDQASSVPGGQDRGPSPLDVMVNAVGACAHYYAAAFLFARQIASDELRVDVESEKTREPVARVGRVVIRVTLPKDFPERYLPAIERAVRNCPAYGTLVHPPDIELTVLPPSRETNVTAA